MGAVNGQKASWEVAFILANEHLCWARAGRTHSKHATRRNSTELASDHPRHAGDIAGPVESLTGEPEALLDRSGALRGVISSWLERRPAFARGLGFQSVKTLDIEFALSLAWTSHSNKEPHEGGLHGRCSGYYLKLGGVLSPRCPECSWFWALPGTRPT